MFRTYFRRLRFGWIRSRRSRTLSDPPAFRYVNWRYRSRSTLIRYTLERVFVGPEDRFGVRVEVLLALSVGLVHHVRGGSVGAYEDLC